MSFESLVYKVEKMSGALRMRGGGGLKSKLS